MPFNGELLCESDLDHFAQTFDEVVAHAEAAFGELHCDLQQQLHRVYHESRTRAAGTGTAPVTAASSPA